VDFLGAHFSQRYFSEGDPQAAHNFFARRSVRILAIDFACRVLIYKIVAGHSPACQRLNPLAVGIGRRAIASAAEGRHRQGVKLFSNEYSAPLCSLSTVAKSSGAPFQVAPSCKNWPCKFDAGQHRNAKRIGLPENPAHEGFFHPNIAFDFNPFGIFRFIMVTFNRLQLMRRGQFRAKLLAIPHVRFRYFIAIDVLHICSFFFPDSTPALRLFAFDG
jgi:hypothetical protein